MRHARIAGVLFGSPGSGSFVEAGVRAFARAVDEFGADVSLHWLDRADPQWRLTTLRTLAASGPALIVLHGAQGEALVQALAADYPQVQFSVSQGDLCTPNVSSYEVLLEQPAFLAGMLAGWATRSGVVGHLSGERVRAGLKGRAAFASGLLHAAPQVRLCSSFCGQQHDPALAARCITAQRVAGADIVFTMLGAGRSGAIRVCRESGMRQIGDGIDWCATDPDVFLASAVADSGWGSFRAIEALLDGQLTRGRRETVGLENPAICRLATAPDVSAEMTGQLDAIAADILRGAVVVGVDWEGVEFDPCDVQP